MKKRLDVVLVERGLAESRSQAQALVLAGLVHGYDKPGAQVADDVVLDVERPPRFVSRGGEKLQNALDGLGLLVAGRDCADVGASTGGFTDCLLQAGARRVLAIDVGYGQLHPRLRSDPRVTVLERVNARTLTELPYAPELVVCDVAFISVTKMVSRSMGPRKMSPKRLPAAAGAAAVRALPCRQISGSSTRFNTHAVASAGRTPMKNTARHPHSGRTTWVISAAAA
jgi:predicted rRNA methylase YqxC with S4 and FtsJ domains